MTPRERWLAAIRMEPVDRLPFWPKLDDAYPMAQEGRFKNMDIESINEWIGSDNHVWIPPCLKEKHDTTSVEHSRNGNESRTVFKTAQGRMEAICHFDETSCSWHPVKFPVETPDDILLMTDIFEDISVDPDIPELEKAAGKVRSIGQNAVTNTCFGKSPLMSWVEDLAGVETGHYLLADQQENVEKLFAAMQKVLVEKGKTVCKCHPADLIYLSENTSTTLISPDQYRAYCSRHVGECANIAKASGRYFVIHMCGHLKGILPELSKLSARAFEAFTSPTLGNTTLLDGRLACPDKCLIGGTNAMLWLKTPQEIISQIRNRLDELPHHRGIVVSPAGLMPPMCKPETIREVCEWVKTYPVRN
ncbi:MAG: uroporphyrinogen decarboxylase family protein [Victivallales bacterium]|jgi:uroporphyrinogen-III decarboxylase